MSDKNVDDMNGELGLRARLGGLSPEEVVSQLIALRTEGERLTGSHNLSVSNRPLASVAKQSAKGSAPDLLATCGNPTIMKLWVRNLLRSHTGGPHAHAECRAERRRVAADPALRRIASDEWTGFLHGAHPARAGGVLGAAGDAGGFPGHAVTRASEADPVGKFMQGRRNTLGRVSRSSVIHVGARLMPVVVRRGSASAWDSASNVAISSSSSPIARPGAPRGQATP